MDNHILLASLYYLLNRLQWKSYNWSPRMCVCVGCEWQRLTELSFMSYLSHQNTNKPFSSLVITTFDFVISHWRIPPPPRFNIFSISCSFRSKIGKVIGWRPHLVNSGSATLISWSIGHYLDTDCVEICQTQLLLSRFKFEHILVV